MCPPGRIAEATSMPVRSSPVSRAMRVTPMTSARLVRCVAGTGASCLEVASRVAVELSGGDLVRLGVDDRKSFLAERWLSLHQHIQRAARLDAKAARRSDGSLDGDAAWRLAVARRSVRRVHHEAAGDRTTVGAR